MPLPWKDVPKLLLPALLLWTIWFAAWGFDDLGGFFAHPARAGTIVVLAAAVALMLIWRPDIQPFRKGTSELGRQKYLLVAVVIPFFLFMLVAPYGDRRGFWVFGESDALRYAGLAIHIVGVVIRLVGLRTLDRQFSGYVTLQEDHKLVQTGIYGVIRHPLYLGGALAQIGLLLVFRSWVVVPVVFLAALFLSYRIPQEERLLAEHFGAEFEAYRRHTWRLLPYLY